MLYKFHPPTAFSLSNLERRIFYCRHFADFNDPFEFWSNVSSGIPTDADPGRMAQAIRTWGFDDGKVPPDLAESAVEYFESLEDAQPDFSVLFDHTRITCFSTDPGNLLMWSHYADGLRGFCVGFDETGLMDEASSRDEYLTAVEYLDAPPDVDSFIFAVAEDQLDYHLMAIDETRTGIERLGKKETWAGELDDYQQAADDAFETMKQIWRRAFAAKPRQWEYEQETRLLVRTDRSDREPVERAYAAPAVRQVIAGDKMDPSYRRALEELLSREYPAVPLLLATQSRQSYGLDLIPKSGTAR